MKKFIFMTSLMLFSITCFGQMPVRQFINEKDYELVDSLPLERFQTYVPDSNLVQNIQERFGSKVKENDIIQLGNCEYMFKLPVKDKILLKYNKDKTKAIIINSSIIHGIGMHFFEFNVKDDERRQVLYYDDDNVLCGIIYDKFYRVAKYFHHEKKEVGKRQFRRMRRAFRRNF